MKKIRIILSLFAFMFFMNVAVNAQMIYDFKVKDPANEKDRTMMLDILRAGMYQQYKQQFIFKVNHFKVGGGYAYFVGDAERKDGREIVFPEDESHDCCYVGALFVNKGGKWYIQESCIFPTDVCNMGVSARNPRAPVAIFDDAARKRY